MSEPTAKTKSDDIHRQEPAASRAAETDKPRWESPKMEDVSEQVMAQPYIRFT